MSENVASLNPVSSGRLRMLIVPREHGAWGMLLIPLLTGAAVAYRSDAVLPLLTFATLALLLFWLRTPVESCLGTTPMRAQAGYERQRVAAIAGVLAAVSALLLFLLLRNGQNRALLLIGSAAAAAFCLQAVVKKVGRRMRMPAQIIGAVGLTSCAPAAYCVATGNLDAKAIALWLTSWFFAADQIHFVQLRIHGARIAEAAGRFRHGRVFLCAQAGMLFTVLLLTYLQVFPRWTALAFVPILVRGTLWFVEEGGPLVVRRLGWTELAQAVTFGVLLTAAFRLP